MPNHYTNMLFAFPDERDVNLVEALDGWWDKALHRNRPMPDFPEENGLHPAWYTWAIAHWGTKWDCYSGEDPLEVPGDCRAVLLIFVTAWSPPNQEMRALLSAEIQRLGAGKVAWVGLDPYDQSAQMLPNGGE